MDPQIQAGSANKSLVDISAGKVNSALVDNISVQTIIPANKLKNSILRAFVKAFRDSKIDERVIVDLLLNLDEGAERNIIDEKFIEEFKKDPDYINKLASRK